MKAIADSLGLSAMSLYRYVDGKDDVVDLLVDEAYGLPEPELTASGPWRDRVGAWARAAATTLRARPWITEIPMSRPPMGPNTVSWTEAGVQAFDDVALTGQQKLNALLLSSTDSYDTTFASQRRWVSWDSRVTAMSAGRATRTNRRQATTDTRRRCSSSSTMSGSRR